MMVVRQISKRNRLPALSVSDESLYQDLFCYNSDKPWTDFDNFWPNVIQNVRDRKIPYFPTSSEAGISSENDGD